MSIFELFLTACGLSMDAFAVSVTNGLCVRKGRVRGALMCGIIFGLFQGIMPAIGYALGMNFAEYCGVHREVRPLDSFDTAWVHRVEHDMRFGGR